MPRKPRTDLSGLPSIYRQWERIEDRRQSMSKQLKDLFKDAKDDGYSPKSMRIAFKEIYRVNHQTFDEAEKREKADAEAEVYMLALARVRESEPNHDPETGEIIEGEVGKEFPASELRRDEGGEGTAPALSANPIQPSESTATQTRPADQQDETQSTAPRSDVGDNSTEGGPAPAVLDPVAATTPPAGEAPPVATNSQTREGMPGERPGTPVAAATEGQGAPSVASRPDGCLNPSVCASSSWRRLCHSCSKASLAPVGLTIGAADIEHHGVVQ